MKLYNELADWWPLMSGPDEYVEEAAIYAGHLLGNGSAPAQTLVEFGSGGGNNASHMKRHFAAVTLVEPSPGMLAVSRALNPDCEHIEGDMRSARLGRQFDRVFIHDAICYMTSLADLRQAIETAYVHCRPGGAAVLAPDFVRENFRAGADCGGNDGEARALRYLEWTWDPDPSDCTYIADYAYVLRDAGGEVRLEHDRHEEGLFPRADWLAILAEVGFEARALAFEHSEIEDWAPELFVAVRPAGSAVTSEAQSG